MDSLKKVERKQIIQKEKIWTSHRNILKWHTWGNELKADHKRTVNSNAGEYDLMYAGNESLPKSTFTMQ